MQEQIIRLPHSGVDQNQHSSDQKRQQDIERRVGQKQEHKCEHQEHSRHQSIVNQIAEEDQRLISKEIEEQPNGEHGGEDDEGDRMPEEAQEENQEDDNDIIHTEVGDVGFDARESVAEVERESEGVEIEHEPPWNASGEAGFETLFAAGDKVKVGGSSRSGGGGDRAVGGHRGGGDSGNFERRFGGDDGERGGRSWKLELVNLTDG